MTRRKRFAITTPDGNLHIVTSSVEDDQIERLDWIARKTCFALSRSWLTNGDMAGDELEEWRRNVHFEAHPVEIDSETSEVIPYLKPWLVYHGPVLFGYRSIDVSDLPRARETRHLWFDDGEKIQIGIQQ